MNEITCLEDLIRIRRNYEEHTTKPYYRGQSDSSWKLLPSLSRIKTTDLAETELKIIDSFKNELLRNKLELIQSHPTDNFLYGDLWNFLFQSQHLGLPTRLLDWSLSPLTALFFAVNESFNFDGKLYVLEFDRRSHYNYNDIREERLFDNDPTNFNRTVLINQSFTALTDNQVKLGEERMKNQFGRFLFQQKDQITIPFEETCFSAESFRLIEFIIPACAKTKLIEELNQENINSETLALIPKEEINVILEKIKKQYQ